MSIKDISSVQNLITAEVVLRMVSVKDQRDYIFLMISRYKTPCNHMYCKECALSRLHHEQYESSCNGHYTDTNLIRMRHGGNRYSIEELVNECHKRATYFRSIIKQYKNNEYPFK